MRTMTSMSFIRGFFAFFMDILETVVFMGAMFIVVYLYILQPNQVKGSSMIPTFENQDYIFTSRITYKLKKPERGDVVVFKSPQNPDIEYIKRVIALPGDTVSFTNCRAPDNTDCDVSVNDYPLVEKYIKERTQLFENSLYIPDEMLTVPPDHFFVMGDNRPGSLDSRIFGPVSTDSIIGVVFFRYLPREKAGAIHNPFTSQRGAIPATTP